MSNKNDHDTYIIPPNFIETGTFFGGMFRARNVIEAGILVFAIGAPVFLFLPFGLTTRIRGEPFAIPGHFFEIPAEPPRCRR